MMALMFSPHSAEQNARFLRFGNDFASKKGLEMTTLKLIIYWQSMKH